jgi:hypothetical protein
VIVKFDVAVSPFASLVTTLYGVVETGSLGTGKDIEKPPVEFDVPLDIFTPLNFTVIADDTAKFFPLTVTCLPGGPLLGTIEVRGAVEPPLVTLNDFVTIAEPPPPVTIIECAPTVAVEGIVIEVENPPVELRPEAGTLFSLVESKFIVTGEPVGKWFAPTVTALPGGPLAGVNFAAGLLDAATETGDSATIEESKTNEDKMQTRHTR